MNDLPELPRARAISNTSGGTGKKIDSVFIPDKLTPQSG